MESRLSTFVFLIVLSVTKAELDLRDRPFKKVTTNLPSYATSTYLAEKYMGGRVNPRIECGAFCKKNVQCRLFCFTESKCEIFSGHMTDHYAGVSNSPYFFSACYSSWHFPNNLALGASAFTSTALYGSTAEQALLGYTFHDTPCSYSGNTASGLFWVADLSSTMNVSYIAVVPSYHDYSFGDVEIRLGDNVNFAENPILAYFNGTMDDIDPLKIDITFVPSSGVMAGRFLSFQGNSGNYLYLCAVVIVGP